MLYHIPSLVHDMDYGLYSSQYYISVGSTYFSFKLFIQFNKNFKFSEIINVEDFNIYDIKFGLINRYEIDRPD